MDDKYFTEEINYLLDQGKEFAKRHPQKARMLHIDDARSREPNVERLIESFAFLTSRIRKRLDDDFPLVADGLLSLMWPGYINPIPSFCILEFLASVGELSEVISIPKGMLVESEPVMDGVRCRFRTCLDVDVLPVKITQVSVSAAGAGSVLKFSFELSKEADISSLRNFSMKMQMVGEFFPTLQIYNLLLGKNGRRNNVEKLSISASDADGKTVGSWVCGPERISAVGLTKDEVLIPTGKTTLWSFSLLRDFFVFPEKFQAFRLHFFDLLAEQPGISKFDVSIHIDCQWPSNLRVATDQFRLNTVPIVNLFSHDAIPINLNRHHYHYTVRGDIKNPEHYHVYSVDSVEGLQVGTSRRTVYNPLYTSRSGEDTSLDGEKYYSIDRGRASWGGWETFIGFVDSSSQPDFAEEEIVSLEVTCTNGNLPTRLLPNQLIFPVTHIDEGLTVRNISHPTAYVLPDIEKISLWRWLSHAALNYLSIQSSEQLKSLLSLHDFSESDANKHKIEGIKSVQMSPTRTLYKGALIPGISLELTVKEDNFSNLGEIQLFAHVLSVFFSSYASINSHIQLTVNCEPSNHKIVLQPAIGDSFQL
jgi:type VI secretion system protein ImpG